MAPPSHAQHLSMPVPCPLGVPYPRPLLVCGMALITQKIRGAIPGLRLGLRRGVSTALGAVGDSYIVPAGTREAFERDGTRKTREKGERSCGSRL
jgi:hypothetical protein